MQLLRTDLLLFLVFVANKIQAELNPDGENVCLQKETYQEIIEVEVQKPVEEKKRRRCFKLPTFTCYKLVTTMKTVKEPRVVLRTKITSKCCKGYKEEKGQKANCVPVCLKGCRNGKCVAPDFCACAPGFYGPQCETECPDNFWGENCVKCDCSDNGKCDKIFGECNCEAGWTGKRCELPCQKGFYGYSCKEKCNCDDHLCNHKTGECTATTTVISVSHTLTTPESVATTTNSEMETPDKVWEQTEMSISTTEVIMETFSISKASTVLKGNSLGAAVPREYETVSEEMASQVSDSIVDGNKTTKLPEEASESEKNIKLINFEMDFSSNFDITTQNINNLENETREKSSSEIYSTSNNVEETTYWISATGNQQNGDINETNNFVGERKETSESQRTFTMFYFLPSFTVISSVSILIIIIAAKWVISTYRNKIRKMQTKTVKNVKFCQHKEEIKFQTENFFWVNNCTKNPVYLSDVDLSNTTPILETFKPLSAGASFNSKEHEIKNN